VFFLLIWVTNVANFQTSKGPVPCDDKEGHYIIVPDDVIARRCA
jgi:dual-specificity kinase